MSMECVFLKTNYLSAKSASMAKEIKGKAVAHYEYIHRHGHETLYDENDNRLEHEERIALNKEIRGMEVDALNFRKFQISPDPRMEVSDSQLREMVHSYMGFLKDEFGMDLRYRFVIHRDTNVPHAHVLSFGSKEVVDLSKEQLEQSKHFIRQMGEAIYQKNLPFDYEMNRLALSVRLLGPPHSRNQLARDITHPSMLQNLAYMATPWRARGLVNPSHLQRALNPEIEELKLKEEVLLEQTKELGEEYIKLAKAFGEKYSEADEVSEQEKYERLQINERFGRFTPQKVMSEEEQNAREQFKQDWKEIYHLDNKALDAINETLKPMEDARQLSLFEQSPNHLSRAIAALKDQKFSGRRHLEAYLESQCQINPEDQDFKKVVHFAQPKYTLTEKGFERLSEKIENPHIKQTLSSLIDQRFYGREALLNTLVTKSKLPDQIAAIHQQHTLILNTMKEQPLAKEQGDLKYHPQYYAKLSELIRFFHPSDRSLKKLDKEYKSAEHDHQAAVLKQHSYRLARGQKLERSYRLTTHSIERLRSDGAPETLIGKVQTLSRQEFRGSTSFNRALKTNLSGEEYSEHASKLFHLAKDNYVLDKKSLEKIQTALHDPPLMEDLEKLKGVYFGRQEFSKAIYDTLTREEAHTLRELLYEVAYFRPETVEIPSSYFEELIELRQKYHSTGEHEQLELQHSEIELEIRTLAKERMVLQTETNDLAETIKIKMREHPNSESNYPSFEYFVEKRALDIQRIGSKELIELHEKYVTLFKERKVLEEKKDFKGIEAVVKEQRELKEQIKSLETELTQRYYLGERGHTTILRQLPELKKSSPILRLKWQPFKSPDACIDALKQHLPPKMETDQLLKTLYRGVFK